MIESQFSPIFKSIQIPTHFQVSCRFQERDFFSLKPIQMKKIKEALNELVPLVMKIEEESIRELEVFGFLEKLVSMCIGSESLYPFLDACFL